MLALLLLSMVGIAGIAAMGFLDDSDATPEDDVDDADLGAKAALLDDSEMRNLDDKLAEDPLLAQGEIGSEDAVLVPYEGEEGVDAGTDGPDLIELDEKLGSDGDPPFAGAGDDVVLGNSGDNVAFGEDGDDILFGRGGFDQLFGGTGDDTIAGADGADLIVGERGSDVIYGGAGDDNIFDKTNGGPLDGPDRVDVISGGAGDDGVVVQDGINLVSLGAGSDHVTVYGEAGGNPAAIITDFDPQQDSLLLGIHAPDYDLPNGVNGIALPYTLREIDTDLGRATLVQPAGTDSIGADDLGDGASVGYAVLVGIRPDQLAGADIRVVLNTPETNVFAAGSVEAVAKEMGATRI